MTIISLRIGRKPAHNYLLKNTSVKSGNPLYVEKGDKLFYVDGLYNKKTATVENIFKTDILPSSVTRYIELTESGEFCGLPITGEIKKKLTKR